jgi:hypothetical protein
MTHQACLLRRRETSHLQCICNLKVSRAFCDVARHPGDCALPRLADPSRSHSSTAKEIQPAGVSF